VTRQWSSEPADQAWTKKPGWIKMRAGADHLPRPCGCCRHYCQDTGRRL